MPRNRSTGLLAAAAVSTVLLASVYSLRHAPDPHLVARWWPATALGTAWLVSSRQRLLPAFAGVLFLAVSAAALLAGHDVPYAVGLGLANAAEAATVACWLRRDSPERPELRSWRDFGRWVQGIALGSVIGAVVTATAVWSDTGAEPWRPLVWVAITHAAAQSVLLPFFLQAPRHRVRLSVVEVLGHLALLSLAAAACVAADKDQPVAFLLLPLLMWAAARFTRRWASIELLGVACGIAFLTAAEAGPFHTMAGDVSVLDMAGSSQAFVGISAITAMAFSVAMCHVRDSLTRIREKELQVSQLLDSASGTAFIATDLEGTITLFSPGAEQLLGYTSQEVVGRTSPLPFHESREIVARARELGIAPSYAVITHPLGEGADQDTRDWTYIAKDGSRSTVSLSATAVRDADGWPVSYLGVVRDVTDRRAAEQALVFALDKEREANQRMQELDQAKGEFVSAVSHELRTPLTSIVGYTELLTDGVTGDLTATQMELIERIDRNGERLLHLVEDLLTLARVEDGSFRVEPVRVDLRDAVRDGTGTQQQAAARGGVRLEVSLPEQPAMVDGDPHSLERLVSNLVDNAVKFSPDGGVVVVSLDVHGDVATMTVRDRGMGIPEAEQHRLFQRFFRSSLATEHAVQGTGLGLNIVRSIAEAHHGTVRFESTPGVGTTFWFSVPLAAPSDPASVPARPGTRTGLDA